MANERFRRLLEAALREAAGGEHERLKTDLNEWALAQGYPNAISNLPSGRLPDVLRYDPAVKHLFVGDAKNSENETPRHSGTTRRVAGYVREFGDLLTGDSVHGGIIAVATNNADEAAAWVVALNLFCVMSSITDQDDNGPDFQVLKLANKNTWITWW